MCRRSASNLLTIVIPVKKPPALETFVKENFSLLRNYKIITIDSGGGEDLRGFSAVYIRRNVPFWEARKLGYSYVQTPYILNLDCDVIVPEGYVEDAVALLETKASAVSIFYEDVGHCQGALEFGVSTWKIEVLRKLYDFSLNLASDGKIVKVGSQAYSALNHGWCECTYMWRKLKFSGSRLETLTYRAKHLK